MTPSETFSNLLRSPAPLLALVPMQDVTTFNFMRVIAESGLPDSPCFARLTGMSTVAEIKSAIDRLTFEERCELEALLHPRIDDDWDRQMAADAEPGGKLDQLKQASIKAAEAGKLKDFPSPARK